MNPFDIIRKPLEGYLEEGSQVYTEKIEQQGSCAAFGVDAEHAITEILSEEAGGGFGDTSWYPTAPWFMSGSGARRVIRDIRRSVRDGLLGASESVADGLVHQFTMLQEQGELHARYARIYGIVREMPGQSCETG